MSELSERLRDIASWNGNVGTTNAIDAADSIDALEARVAELEGALEWYGENARLCRLIHSEGDPGRHALAEDGGKRAKAALSTEGDKR
tara:strand:+ start:2564 stop:2827 length:264 start_codon:yes stop_codon:yes gene_type:complete